MTGYDKGALQNRLGLFNELQRAAREITLPLFFEGPDAVNKAENGYDPVTQADMDAERRLRELISEAFPEDTIKGEEFDDIPGANDWSWTLDPIDGTRGFVAGVPVWSTLVAVSFQDTPLLGLIDLPALNTSFWGTPGKTWREGTHGGVTTLT
ncbi:MAG: histidinol-phosphatase, partial [Hyphomonadaceae bacterium]|nr:histidinol-phosphatase [Hyphomonadaceae bacterium]